MGQSMEMRQQELLTQLTPGFNAFALRLFKVLDVAKEENAFSPISVACCLGMLCLGAGGRTGQQLTEALKIPENPEGVDIAFRTLMDFIPSLCHGKASDFERSKSFWNRVFSLVLGIFGQRSSLPSGNSETETFEVPNEIVLLLANSAWGHVDYPFRVSFQGRAKQIFDAEIKNLPFQKSPSQAIEEINQWVKRKTQGRIKAILEKNRSLGSVTLVLVNAVYFKAAWANRFDEKATRPGPFHLGTGGKVTVDLMRQDAQFGYYRDEAKDVEVLEMPYGDGTLSMWVLLPGMEKSLAGLEETLSAGSLNSFAGKLAMKHVEVILPRFKVEASLDLKPPLEKLGVQEIFGKEADLQGLSEVKPLWVSQVLHKVWIEVNEKGAEAAAATAAVALRGMGKPRPEVTFCADRPFLFCIRDRVTGILWFLGRMVRPKQEG